MFHDPAPHFDSSVSAQFHVISVYDIFLVLLPLHPSLLIYTPRVALPPRT